MASETLSRPFLWRADPRLLAYVGLVIAAAMLVGVIGAERWQSDWGGSTVLRMAIAVALAILTGTAPLRISPQTQTSLLGAPLFLAILVLSPAQAIAVGGMASLTVDLRYRRRPEVLILNAAMTCLTVGAAAAVFRGLGGSADGTSLLSATQLGYAGAAGGVLYAVNKAVVAGWLWLGRRPSSLGLPAFPSWIAESFQEAGVLALGFVGAVLLADRWWAILFLVTPLALVHMTLSQSVREAARNLKLAEILGKQMSELKAAQAQLVQSEKMASIGTLAAGVAHELNNPLFVISGRAELLQASGKASLATEKAEEHVAVILEMAQRASGIVSDLLHYSRRSEEREPVLIREAMATAVRLIGKQITGEGMTIVDRLEDTPPVEGVPSQLQQVFVNLLLNARDAMEEGGEVTITCHAVDGHVRAIVQDTGVGILPEHLDHLFEPFYTTKAVGEGTGLGLYLCHKIVTEHRGRIRIESLPGGGTKVIVELPCAS